LAIDQRMFLVQFQLILVLQNIVKGLRHLGRNFGLLVYKLLVRQKKGLHQSTTMKYLLQDNTSTVTSGLANQSPM
jgi:hypothetical protein